jgi:hypothetical protein
MVYLYCEKVKGDTSSCNDLLYISIPTQRHFDKQSRCFCFIKRNERQGDERTNTKILQNESMEVKTRRDIET